MLYFSLSSFFFAKFMCTVNSWWDLNLVLLQYTTLTWIKNEVKSGQTKMTSKDVLLVIIFKKRAAQEYEQ